MSTKFLKTAEVFCLDWIFRRLANSRLSRRLARIFGPQVMSLVADVNHDGTALKFLVPNDLNAYRVNTFSLKEPETLSWIESFSPNAVFWDVGANVGLYSCFAGVRGNKVFSFEPSMFNLEILARNISINGLSDSVTIVPNAVSDKSGAETMKLTSSDWGGALSSFGVDHGWDGNPIKTAFEYITLGASLDSFVSDFQLPAPTYLKIDVDGIEHLILRGAAQTLKHVKSLLVEINEDFPEQASQCADILKANGFTLVSKSQSDMMARSSAGFASCFNQIWEKQSS